MDSTKGFALLWLIGLTAIVKQSVAQGCASGWESQVANGTNCFMFMPDDHMGWNDAQQACRGMRSDSNLASIYSKEKNDWIGHKMEVKTDKPTFANYWIGLKYDANVEDFVWIDGCPKTFEYWADGEPNNIDAEEDCGEVSLERHDQGKWNDIGCGYEFGYVCKYSAESCNGAVGTNSVLKWRGILFFIFTALLPSIL